MGDLCILKFTTNIFNIAQSFIANQATSLGLAIDLFKSLKEELKSAAQKAMPIL